MKKPPDKPASGGRTIRLLRWLFQRLMPRSRALSVLFGVEPPGVDVAVQHVRREWPALGRWVLHGVPLGQPQEVTQRR